MLSLAAQPLLLRRALSSRPALPTQRQPLSTAAPSAMPPKRKVTAKSTAEPSADAKKAKPAKGLTVGEQFPDIGPLETDDGKMVNLKVRLSPSMEAAGRAESAERA